jgi:acetyl esterase/lipase
MKRLLPLLVVLISVSSLAQTPRPTVSVPDWVTLEANIPYDKYQATVLDIMYPKAQTDQQRPGVVVFHGGGWIRSSKETTMKALCLPYLEKGFVICNVEYRVASMAPAPAAVTDALNATKWFFDHADNYNVDPNRIVVTGASAGGHLALMAGMTPESVKLGPTVKIAAIINGYGITEVADLLQGPHRKSWAVEWVPEQPERMELAKRVSPMTYVRKNLPPTLTVQGENDTTVPLEHGIQLTKALQEAKVDAQIIIVPNAGHGFSAKQWPEVNTQIFEFLTKRGIIKKTTK